MMVIPTLVGVIPALFLSFFPAIFGTVTVIFVATAIQSVPFYNARREILRKNTATNLTKQAIESLMIQQYPELYDRQLKIGQMAIWTFFGIYTGSFIILMIGWTYIT